MSAELAAQIAIRARLIGTSAVTGLVPADHILDRNARPTRFPAILLGEDQALDANRIARNVVQVFSTLHVWKKEQGTEGVKSIVGAIRASLRDARPQAAAPFRIGDCVVSSVRYLRDPDGETSHAVVTVESMVSEVA